jgi:hypothetical protein
MIRFFLRKSSFFCVLLVCVSCYGGQIENLDITYPIQSGDTGGTVIDPDNSSEFGVRVYVAESVSSLEMKIKINTMGGSLNYKGYTVLLTEGESDVLSIDGYGCVNNSGIAMFAINKDIRNNLDVSIVLYFLKDYKYKEVMSLDVAKYRVATNKLRESGAADAGWFNGVGRPLSKSDEIKYSSKFDCL